MAQHGAALNALIGLLPERVEPFPSPNIAFLVLRFQGSYLRWSRLGASSIVRGKETMLSPGVVRSATSGASAGGGRLVAGRMSGV
jgi:hypothetical protein